MKARDGLIHVSNLFHSAPYKSYFPDRLTDAVVENDTYVKVVSATLGWTYNHASSAVTAAAPAGEPRPLG